MRMVLGDDNGDGKGDHAWSSPELVGDVDWLPGASDVFPDPYCDDFLLWISQSSCFSPRLKNLFANSQ